MFQTSLPFRILTLNQDTAAGAISTLFYYLAIHPEIQARARVEALSAYSNDDEVDVDSISGKAMPYLTACIREALRINTSISYIVPREAEHSLQVGPYTVPDHTPLIINIYSIHHNGHSWSDSHIFRPERFLDDQDWKKHGWLPFALGPRQCPARNFAMYEQRALAAVMLRRYSWSLPEHSIHRDSLKNAMSPFALTLPHDLVLNFVKLNG